MLSSVLNSEKAMVDDYGIEIKPSGFELTQEMRSQMTKSIVESAPDGSTTDFSDWPAKVWIRNIPQEYADQYTSGQTTIELIIKHPYEK